MADTPTPIFSPEDVEKIAVTLDEAGFTMKAHALRAHDEALRDAVAAAEQDAEIQRTAALELGDAVAVLTEERDALKARQEGWDDEFALIVELKRRVAVLEAGLRDAVWQFNEAVSMLREARGYLLPTTGLAEEIDEGIDAMQAALEAAALLGRVPAAAPPAYERIGQAVLSDHGWSFDDRTDVDWSDTGWVPVYRRVPAAAPERCRECGGVVDSPGTVRYVRCTNEFHQRCPTCGSTDRAVFLEGCEDTGQPDSMDLGGNLIYAEPDAWHGGETPS